MLAFALHPPLSVFSCDIGGQSPPDYGKGRKAPLPFLSFPRRSVRDAAVIQELYELFKDPYALARDPPGAAAKYYRRAPPETYEGVGVGGSTYMSCSS